MSPRRVHALATSGTDIRAAGISLDSRTVLVDRGAFLFGKHVVETIPFGGGQPTRIASGDQAAWND
ncbi:MAG TPA: hypothetical protein VMA77_15585 [Solirubrobacteraceae bacterium]|nr:hypothetical protein [Solirubrobacteraceae bacterium]